MRAVSIIGTGCGPTAKTSLAVTGELIENATILAPIAELILREKIGKSTRTFNSGISKCQL